jgi:hypothetical protein
MKNARARTKKIGIIPDATRASSAFPVRIVTIDAHDMANSNFYDELVTQACLAAKTEEQRRLELEQQITQKTVNDDGVLSFTYGN